MKVKPFPPSTDHIVKIQPSTDIMLATDNDGNELARLYFEVAGRKVFFLPPSLANWPHFTRKMAILFSYWARVSGNVEMPESPVDAFNGKPHPVWDKVTATMLAGANIIQEMVIEIFFKYLGVQIQGITGKRHWWGGKVNAQKWFAKHGLTTDLQKILAACLAVDDMVKKNATFLLEREFRQRSAEGSSKLTLLKKQNSQSDSSIPTPFSSSDSI